MMRTSVLTRYLVLALVAAIAIPLAGCGKKAIENPYEPVTLAQAVGGESANKLFKFELDTPEILAVQGKLALLREGDRIEFLIGDDLSLLSGIESGAQYKLGVLREFGTEPEIYLVLEHYIAENDTSFITADEPPVFPSYLDLSEFDASPYASLATELAGLSSREAASLVKSFGRKGEKIWMKGELSSAEVEGLMRYYVETSQGKFILEGMTPQGELFLKAVETLGLDFECGGPLGKFNSARLQRETGVTGPLTLERFVFQGYVVTNG